MTKKILVVGTFLFFLGCTKWDDAILRHQQRVHNALLVQLGDGKKNDAERRKLKFGLYPPIEQVSYTKERIDKYFETTNNIQNLDELDETYREIEKTKKQ